VVERGNELHQRELACYLLLFSLCLLALIHSRDPQRSSSFNFLKECLTFVCVGKIVEFSLIKGLAQLSRVCLHTHVLCVTLIDKDIFIETTRDGESLVSLNGACQSKCRAVHCLLEHRLCLLLPGTEDQLICFLRFIRPQHRRGNGFYFDCVHS